MLKFILTSVISTAAFAASYRVPVPADLDSSAIWNEIRAEASISGDTLSGTYRLPIDLAGARAPAYHFTGKVERTFVHVSGEGVNGYCKLSENKPMTCLLEYPDLVVETTSRDEALNRNFRGSERDRRMQVVTLFSNDPVGLLSVDVR